MCLLCMYLLIVFENLNQTFSLIETAKMKGGKPRLNFFFDAKHDMMME